MNPRKSLKSFFRAGEHLVCRFCSTSIADIVKEKLVANTSYTRILATLESGVQYRFNGCEACMKSADLEDVQEAFKADPAVPPQLRKEKIKSFEIIKTPSKGAEREIAYG